MILADKIINLRKKNGWSQEELGQMLNVSRQSVSKWESMTSIPDLEKIIKMSEIFGVTTDFLLKDELEMEEVTEIATIDGKVTKAEEAVIPTRKLSLDEVNTYIDITEKAGAKFARAVSVCILSPVTVILLGGMVDYGVISISEDRAGGIGTLVLLLMIISSVATFVMEGMKLSKYGFLEKESITLEYGVAGIIERKREKFEPVFRKCIVYGVCLCIFSLVPMMVALIAEAKEVAFVYSVAMLFGFVAVGVYLLVRAAMIRDSYQKLLEEGEYTLEKKLANKKNEKIASIYWCIITAVYLAISFITMHWDRTWILWPVAGVMYGALVVILDVAREKR